MGTVGCLLCSKITVSMKGLATHLSTQHPETSGETYYRRFLMSDQDADRCAYCGEPSSWINITRGFHRFCSVRCARHSPEVIARRNATHVARYGVPFYTQACDFIEQAKSTKHARYGNAHFNNGDKQQATMLTRYGVPHNWSGPAGTRTCDRTKLNRYGSLFYANHEKGRATRLRLYGDAHFNRAACRRTNLMRYGVKWPLQNATILAKNHKFRFYDYKMPSGTVVRVQGYERQALDWLLQRYDESDIHVTKGRVPTFWYVFEDTKHKYFPDAYIQSEHLVVEVKSEYTLRQYRDVLRAKLLAVVLAGYEVMLVIVRMCKNVASVETTLLASRDDVAQFYEGICV